MSPRAPGEHGTEFENDNFMIMCTNPNQCLQTNLETISKHFPLALCERNNITRHMLVKIACDHLPVTIWLFCRHSYPHQSSVWSYNKKLPVAIKTDKYLGSDRSLSWCRCFWSWHELKVCCSCAHRALFVDFLFGYEWQGGPVFRICHDLTERVLQYRAWRIDALATQSAAAQTNIEKSNMADAMNARVFNYWERTRVACWTWDICTGCSE